MCRIIYLGTHGAGSHLDGLVWSYPLVPETAFLGKMSMDGLWKIVWVAGLHQQKTARDFLARSILISADRDHETKGAAPNHLFL